MRLRPELVLLQKTMMTVEGVARRIDPQHDIWAASEPVVRRWIGRELSPANQIRRFADEATTAVRNLARLAEGPVIRAEREIREIHHIAPLPWVALGALLSGLAFLAAMLVR
jgi:ubiquinone biosynthesis protein